MGLILASGSAIRHQMLAQAGVDHMVVRPGVDESAAKAALDKPAAITVELARAKALAVSRDRPGDWVIGSDSIVSVDGRQFDKPADRAQAADHLRRFSDRTMVLTSAVALAQDGIAHWALADEARLQVRPLSDAFIHRYLDAEWPDVGQCVGVFRMEGRGVQLFEIIDGSYFTILG
ncbi:MAG TPA: nucleoside triphosphate pyrophosphatase, partial [Sphingomicrobium sp.]